MSDQQTPPTGDEDPLAKSKQVVADAESDGAKGPDEATRITRIVLIAVILVLVGGLALLLLLGPSDDNSARQAVDDLNRSQVSIREALASETTTTEPVSTETSAPAETAPPETATAPGPAPPPSPSPASPPGPAPTTVKPAELQVFYAVDSQGRLPVKVGLSSQISIRNTGGAEGSWALNAMPPLRVDGKSGTNGRVPGGSITVVNVTVDAATAPTAPTETTIRFDTPNGESKTIRVLITP